MEEREKIYKETLKKKSEETISLQDSMRNIISKYEELQKEFKEFESEKLLEVEKITIELNNNF